MVLEFWTGVRRVVAKARAVAVPVVVGGGALVVSQVAGMCQTGTQDLSTVVTTGATAMQGNLLTVAGLLIPVAAIGAGLVYGFKWLYRLAHS